MKKKVYLQPVIRAVKFECSGIICRSDILEKGDPDEGIPQPDGDGIISTESGRRIGSYGIW